MATPESPDFAYATLADLYAYGAPPSAFGSLTDAQRLTYVAAASREIDGYASRQGLVPLASYGTDVAQKCAAIAAYEALSRVGFNPTAGADVNYRLRAEDARAWLVRWGRGEVTPAVAYASAPGVLSQPHVTSRPLRGW